MSFLANNKFKVKPTGFVVADVPASCDCCNDCGTCSSIEQIWFCGCSDSPKLMLDFNGGLTARLDGLSLGTCRECVHGNEEITIWAAKLRTGEIWLIITYLCGTQLISKANLLLDPNPPDCQVRNITAPGLDWDLSIGIIDSCPCPEAP